MQRLPALSPVAQRLLLVFYVSLVFSLACAVHYARYASPNAVDDAYYYFIIAGNIAQHGLSTFDGQTLTNGYHPLWMAVLVLQYALFSDSVLLTTIIELLLLAGALYLFLALIERPGFIICALFTLTFFKVFYLISLKGMEVSLWAFCFALLVYLCRKTSLSTRDRGCAILGLCATACIGSRIDSVVFILPFLLLALPSLRARMIALVPMAICGAAYAYANWHIFGVPFPISGMIKSLGGFQINRPLIANYLYLINDPHIWKIPYDLVASLYWLMVVLFLLTPFLLLCTPRNSTAWLLLTSYCCGLVLYFVKLFLFSSWIIWDWYCFPVIIALLGVFLILAPKVEDLAGRYPGRRKMAAGLLFLVMSGLLVLFPAAYALHYHNSLHADFAAINKMAVEKFGNVLNGDRVAMGDRSGSFAADYKGPVTQLEGLVNDKEYYNVIAAHGDVHALLCRRGVKYLVSYARDLGDYKEYDTNTIRPFLSQFNAPTLHVTRAQEVGRVYDLNLYDDQGERDSYLYVWRMDCP